MCSLICRLYTILLLFCTARAVCHEEEATFSNYFLSRLVQPPNSRLKTLIHSRRQRLQITEQPTVHNDSILDPVNQQTLDNNTDSSIAIQEHT
jgi:hypothetical protein